MSPVARVGPSLSTVNPSTPLGAGGFGCGSFRITAGASGRGRVRATSSSTSRLLLWPAASSSSMWFRVVSRGASRPMAVRLTAPSASRSRSPGTCVRLAPPGCGDRRRAPTGGAAGAIGEERRAAFREIEAPGVELHQERDELRGRVTLARRRAVNLRQQIAIGQSADGRDVDHHPAHIPSSFSTPGTARHRAIVARDTISAVSRANMRLRRNVVDAAGGPRASRTRRELASQNVSSVFSVSTRAELESVQIHSRGRQSAAGASRAPNPGCLDSSARCGHGRAPSNERTSTPRNSVRTELRVPQWVSQAQSRDRSTAFFHPRYASSRRSGLHRASQRRSAFQFVRTVSRSFQNPTARPAA